ncbi:MAG: hypothetical protein WC659_01350 [Patescibacteria group bacterium]
MKTRGKILWLVAFVAVLGGCAGSSNFKEGGKETFGFQKSAFGSGPTELSVARVNLAQAKKLEYEAKIDSAIAANTTEGNAAQIAFYQALRNAAGSGLFLTAGNEVLFNMHRFDAHEDAHNAAYLMGVVCPVCGLKTR